MVIRAPQAQELYKISQHKQATFSFTDRTRVLVSSLLTRIVLVHLIAVGGKKNTRKR